MRAPLILLSFVLVAPGCSSHARQRRAPGPPVVYPQEPAFGTPAPIYHQPFAVPAAPEAAASAPPATGASSAKPEVPELVACLTEAKAGPQCRLALNKIAETGVGVERVIDVYQRGCEMGEKFLACKVFKSAAIREGDEPQMALLMQCEGGRYEACEDANVKSAPLFAWRSTLKQQGCKAGATYLCDNYRKCPARSQWSCQQFATAKVCGCVPNCEGTVGVRPLDRKWKDGSSRAEFSCTPVTVPSK